MEENIQERFMIRKLIIIIVIIVGVCPIYSQNLSVSSIKRIQADSTCIVSPRYDINGGICAVIKIMASNIMGSLEFKGNIIGTVEKEDSIYTIYVTDKTKRLRMFNPEYIPETIDFTLYEDSKRGVEGNSVYYVYVSGKMKEISSKAAPVSGSRILSFSSNAPIRQLYVNGVEWKIINNNSQRLLPYGEYEYDAITDGNIHKKGKIELHPSIGSLNVNLEF